MLLFGCRLFDNFLCDDFLCSDFLYGLLHCGFLCSDFLHGLLGCGFLCYCLLRCLLCCCCHWVLPPLVECTSCCQNVLSLLIWLNFTSFFSSGQQKLQKKYNYFHFFISSEINTRVKKNGAAYFSCTRITIDDQLISRKSTAGAGLPHLLSNGTTRFILF